MIFPALFFFLYLACPHDLVFLRRSNMKAQGDEKEVTLYKNFLFLCPFKILDLS